MKVGAEVMDEFPHEVASGDLNGGADRPTDVDVTKVVKEPIFNNSNELEDTTPKVFDTRIVVHWTSKLDSVAMAPNTAATVSPTQNSR